MDSCTLNGIKADFLHHRSGLLNDEERGWVEEALQHCEIVGVLSPTGRALLLSALSSSLSSLSSTLLVLRSVEGNIERTVALTRASDACGGNREAVHCRPSEEAVGVYWSLRCCGCGH